MKNNAKSNWRENWLQLTAVVVFFYLSFNEKANVLNQTAKS